MGAGVRRWTWLSLAALLACAGSAPPTAAPAAPPAHEPSARAATEPEPEPEPEPAGAAQAATEPASASADLMPTEEWSQGTPDPFAALDEPTSSEAAGDPCARVVAIRVDKSRRILRAVCESGAVYEFSAGLGRRALGDKDRSGDLRTPEGTYRVAEPARESPYHLFMLLDYPSREDADRGLRDGRIDALTHARIAAAHERAELPPQDTELGGRVGIHGEGPEHQGLSARTDWTFGCIALSDANIEFLALRTPVGTLVEILP